MKLSEFDYNLPNELIAQFPTEKREDSRMMVLNRNNKTIKHKNFVNFIDHLNKSDVLVLNNTKVIPARLVGTRETGGKVEIFLLHPAEGNKTCWYALIKRSKRLKNDDIIKISDELNIKIVEKATMEAEGPTENLVELVFNGNNVYEILDKYGSIPLPPYMGREAEEKDKQTYQTVFAQTPGSVAAPTAGLHFTEDILEKIKEKGVKIVYVTLNVGLGTFLPVKTENILDHKMHFESFEIPKETAEAINNAQGAVVSVGTTVTRTLESTFKKHGKIVETNDETDIFIYPPYEFKVVNKLLTNFHLPKSTLIMLISAMAGKEFIFDAYTQAVAEKYRFFSYGDCMLIE